MLDLTFGEQVKIVLSRKDMTIKELAELIEEKTGKKMSRQNLTQRLGRDNFQEQDMRTIAEILDCPFQLSILADQESVERAACVETVELTEQEMEQLEKFKAKKENKEYEIEEELEQYEEPAEEDEEESEEKLVEEEPVKKEEKKAKGWRSVFQRRPKKEDPVKEESVEEEPEQHEESEQHAEPEQPEYSEAVNKPEVEEMENMHECYQNAVEERFQNSEEEDLDKGERNPYTGREYETNTVRSHPTRIGYVEVYDRSKHQWKAMTEWAFLGLQDDLKARLGSEYKEPIYFD